MRPKMENEVENVFSIPKQHRFNNHLKQDATLRVCVSRLKRQPPVVSKHKASVTEGTLRTLKAHLWEINASSFFPVCCALRGLESSWPERKEGYWVQASVIPGFKREDRQFMYNHKELKQERLLDRNGHFSGDWLWTFFNLVCDI